MSDRTQPACRLFVLLARHAATGVVFRRGPSKKVALIAWDRDTDTFEVGQWFHGRLRERRCDLSPDGRYLGYFASRYGSELATWTAISRPPYLTALALWPNGTSWGGGGLFTGPRAFQINQSSELHDGFTVPADFKISPFGPHAGRGEDHPVWHARLLRDGWTGGEVGQVIKHTLKAPVWIEYDPPLAYRRPNPARARWTLEMRITGLFVRGGPRYRTEHVITDGRRTRPLGPSNWADWDANGDLLLARAGALFRLPVDALATDEPAQIADFTGLAPRPLPPPPGYGW